MKKKFSDELISAYLDEQLSNKERAGVETFLTENADARRLVEELRALRAGLQSLPRHQLEDDFAQRVLLRAEREMLTSKQSSDVAGQVALADQVSRTPASRNWRALLWAGTTVAAAVTLVAFFNNNHQPDESPIGPAVASLDDDRDDKSKDVEHDDKGQSNKNRLGKIVRDNSGLNRPDFKRSDSEEIAKDRNSSNESVRGQKPVTRSMARLRAQDDILRRKALDDQYEKKTGSPSILEQAAISRRLGIDDPVVIAVNVNPKAYESGAFNNLLASNGIQMDLPTMAALEESGAKPGVVHDRLSARSTPTWEFVYVEATAQKLENVVRKMSESKADFFDLTVQQRAVSFVTNLGLPDHQAGSAGKRFEDSDKDNDALGLNEESSGDHPSRQRDDRLVELGKERLADSSKVDKRLPAAGNRPTEKDSKPEDGDAKDGEAKKTEDGVADAAPTPREADPKNFESGEPRDNKKELKTDLKRKRTAEKLALDNVLKNQNKPTRDSKKRPNKKRRFGRAVQLPLLRGDGSFDFDRYQSNAYGGVSSAAMTKKTLEEQSGETKPDEGKKPGGTEKPQPAASGGGKGGASSDESRKKNKADQKEYSPGKKSPGEDAKPSDQPDDEKSSNGKSAADKLETDKQGDGKFGKSKLGNDITSEARAEPRAGEDAKTDPKAAFGLFRSNGRSRTRAQSVVPVERIRVLFVLRIAPSAPVAAPTPKAETGKRTSAEKAPVEK